jgi:hypothetical protein
MKFNWKFAGIFVTLLLLSKDLFNNLDNKRRMLQELFTIKYGPEVARNVLAVYNALAKAGLPIQTIKYCIGQIMYETGNFNPKVSKVAKLNTNYSGITWTGSIAQRASGATKGSARPVSEGGNYAKFPNVDAWAKDYIRILNRLSKPINATSVSDFASKLAKNGYYDTDPKKYPNAVKKYTSALVSYYNFLTKSGI